MSVPEFNPWHDANRPPQRAYRAFCAYPNTEIGTLGTISTLTVSELGKSIDVDTQRWLQLLLAARRPTCRSGGYPLPNLTLINSAIQFCLSHWAQRLIDLGWHEHELFAMTSAGRTGGLIQELAGGHIRFATSDLVCAEVKTKLFHCMRQRSGLCGLPRIWDLRPQG